MSAMVISGRGEMSGEAGKCSTFIGGHCLLTVPGIGIGY